MTRVISVFLAVLFFGFYPGQVPANDAEDRERHSVRRETREGYRVERRYREQKTEHGDKGNEATGQIAAWLFVLANLKVGISILTRFVNRFSGSSKLKGSMTAVSRFLNKHLRKVHYLLNSTALCIAFLHFLLSSCRSSPLPEWGLFFAAIMGLLGLMVKFRVSFKWMRKAVYRIHTASVSFAIVMVALIAGHVIID